MEGLDYSEVCDWLEQFMEDEMNKLNISDNMKRAIEDQIETTVDILYRLGRAMDIGSIDKDTEKMLAESLKGQVLRLIEKMQVQEVSKNV